MASQKSKILLEKYWAAETSRSEEEMLADQFGDKADIDTDHKKYGVIFEYKKAIQEEKAEDFDLSFLDEASKGEPKEKPLLHLPGKRTLRTWSMGLVASAVIAFFSLSYQWPRTQTLEAQSIHMERAYTETLATLQLVADKLNKGNASIHEISVFDRTTKQIIHEK